MFTWLRRDTTRFPKATAFLRFSPYAVFGVHEVQFELEEAYHEDCTYEASLECMSMRVAECYFMSNRLESMRVWRIFFTIFTASFSGASQWCLQVHPPCQVSPCVALGLACMTNTVREKCYALLRLGHKSHVPSAFAPSSSNALSGTCCYIIKIPSPVESEVGKVPCQQAALNLPGMLS